MADVPNVDDVIPGIFEFLQHRVELRSRLVIGLVLRQLVQIDGGGGGSGAAVSGGAVLGDGPLVAGLGAAAQSAADQNCKEKSNLPKKTFEIKLLPWFSEMKHVLL